MVTSEKEWKKGYNATVYHMNIHLKRNLDIELESIVHNAQLRLIRHEDVDMARGVLAAIKEYERTGQIPKEQI